MKRSRPSVCALFLMSLLCALSARADDLYFNVVPVGIPGVFGRSDIHLDESGRFIFIDDVNYGEDGKWVLDSRMLVGGLAGLHDPQHLASFWTTPGDYSVPWLVGAARRVNEEPIGNVFLASAHSGWVTNPYTGQTSIVGLYDADHALPNSAPGATGPTYVSFAYGSSASGKVVGLSHNNTFGSPHLYTATDPYFNGFEIFGYGMSVWMADASAETVTSTRFGLTDAAHTLPEIIVGDTLIHPGGLQISRMLDYGMPNENGDLAGVSIQFGSVTGDGVDTPIRIHAGSSFWVGRMDTGDTYQVGLADSKHTTGLGTRSGEMLRVLKPGGRFVYTDPDQMYYRTYVTRDGFVAGISEQYTAEGWRGHSAWVARFDSDAGEYVTTRVGFFGGYAGGIYQDPNGREESFVEYLTDTGLAAGYSEMLGAPEELGAQSAWVVNIATGSQVEVGLTGTGFLVDGIYRSSRVWAINEDGWVAGQSTIYHEGGSEYWEGAAWVQKVAGSSDASTRAAERIGVLFEPTSTFRENYVYGITRNARVYGEAGQDLESGGWTRDAWVATPVGENYVTTTLGLSGEGFVLPNGSRMSQLGEVFENGVATGLSTRFRGEWEDDDVDYVPWLAKPLPGGGYQTFRVGFYDAFHTDPDGIQASAFVNGVRDSAQSPRYFAGTSDHFTPGGQGQSAWVVDVMDGVTRQVGLVDARHTNVDGVRWSEIAGVNSAGYVWGSSERYYDGSSVYAGSTAWIYTFSDHSLHSFELSVSLDGYARSTIYGVTDDGIAFGSFERFDQDGNSLGEAAFGWTLTRGVFILSERVLNDLTGYGWSGFKAIYFVSENGKFIGVTDEGALFIATLAAIPEPSSCVLLLGLAGLGAGATRRRRR